MASRLCGIEAFPLSTEKSCPMSRESVQVTGGGWIHISREEYRMMRTVFLGVALAFGLATAGSAAVTPAVVGNANSLVIKAAEGCGPGFWRGPAGKCHPMFDGRACPPGYHIGPERKKCWPN